MAVSSKNRIYVPATDSNTGRNPALVKLGPLFAGIHSRGPVDFRADIRSGDLDIIQRGGLA
jgi:hypothetical protein